MQYKGVELPHVLPNPLIFFTSANTLTRSDVFLHLAGVCQVLFLVLCIPLKGAAPTDTLRHISPANIPEFIDATTQVHLMAPSRREPTLATQALQALGPTVSGVSTRRVQTRNPGQSRLASCEVNKKWGQMRARSRGKERRFRGSDDCGMSTTGTISFSLWMAIGSGHWLMIHWLWLCESMRGGIMEKINRGMRAVGDSPFPRVMRMVVVVFGLGCLFCVWCVCLCLLLCSSSSVANKAYVSLFIFFSWLETPL